MPDPIAIDNIPIKQLRFDPENARLPSSINGGDEQAIINWMLEDATIVELMGSIGQQNYFPGEPLLVTRIRGEPDVYHVVEGNRRLAAVKLLNDPEIAQVRKKSVLIVSKEARFRPKELPTLIYDSRKEILNYLGYRHVTGIKPWDPLAKAKYLKDLLATLKEKTFEEKCRGLAKVIGSRADYVSRLLASLAVYEEIEERAFFGIKGLNEQSIDFSVLTTALSYSNIVHFLGLKDSGDMNLRRLNKEHLKDLTSWLFEEHAEGKTRLGESRELKSLNQVVTSKKALEAFRHGTPLSDAARFAGVPTDVFRTELQEGKSHLQVARDHVHLVDAPTQSDADALHEIQQLVRLMQDGVEAKLSNRQRPGRA